MLDIPALIDEAKVRKIKNYPCHVNRASQIGHPCLRYLTYSRTSWEEKQLHDVGLQRVFDLGNLYEQALIKDLQEAGIYLEEQQTSYSDPRYQLTGHIDGKLPLNGHKYPIEIKSMSPYTWEKITEWRDFLRQKAPYLRGYPYQMQAYLYLKAEEMGLMFLVNKVSGQIKQLEIPLDYDLAEEMLQRCEAINSHVTAGTLPDRIEWEESVCGRCGFLHICYPDRDYGAGVQIIDDAELEAMLDKRERLAQVAKEYQEVDKSVKEMVKGQGHMICAGYEILGKMVVRKGYTVSASEYWQTTIKKITS